MLLVRGQILEPTLPVARGVGDHALPCSCKQAARRQNNEHDLAGGTAIRWLGLVWRAIKPPSPCHRYSVRSAAVACLTSRSALHHGMSSTLKIQDQAAAG